MNALRKVVFAMAAGLILGAGPARAQLTGSGVGGDWGMKAASQPPPGYYLGYLMYGYDTSTIVGKQGNEFQLAGSLGVRAHVAVSWIVTNKKLFGANYSTIMAFSVPNLAIEAPRLDLKTGNYGFGDLYVQPINLGWHKNRADFMAWYGVYMPTGDMAKGTGQGMWSHEIAGGATFFLNKGKTWHAAALPVLEFHTKKQDSDLQVGNILTVKGGVGKTSMKILDLGMGYYTRWKISDDSGLGIPAIVQSRLGKNRNYGLGPEASIVLPLKKDLSKLAIVDFKYFFETGTVLSTKGRTMVFTVLFKLF